MGRLGLSSCGVKPLFFMAITKEKKVEIIDKVKKAIADSQSVVFVNFAGLSVNEATILRQELRDNEVGYMVAKKTLLTKVFNESGIGGQLPNLDGEIAIAYGQDLVAPAKGIYGFKERTKKLDIVGGVFEGAFMDKGSMEEIAQIPSREILYGKLANVINSPIQGFVIALDQLAQSKA